MTINDNWPNPNGWRNPSPSQLCHGLYHVQSIVVEGPGLRKLQWFDLYHWLSFIQHCLVVRSTFIPANQQFISALHNLSTSPTLICSNVLCLSVVEGCKFWLLSRPVKQQMGQIQNFWSRCQYNLDRRAAEIRLQYISAQWAEINCNWLLKSPGFVP